MEYKNISSKFTLQVKTKYIETRIQTFFEGLLPWVAFSDMSQKIHSAKVSYCQNSDIRELSIALVQ